MAKYKQAVVKEILASIEEGLSQKDAAMLAGISEDTFYTWKKEKPEFSELLERAILKYKQKLIGYVNTSAVKDGKLALEVLSRKWPQEFGKDGTPVPNIQVNNLETTDISLEQAMRIEQKMRQGLKAERDYYKKKYKSAIAINTAN